MQDIPNKIDLTTTLPASEFNSHKNEIQELVIQSGQTLDINEQDQLRAAISVFARALVCNDTGTANTYVLARATTLTDVKALYDGMTIAFQTSNTNTGASTVNFNSLGAVPIVKNNIAIAAGDIDSDMFIILVYNSANSNFEIFNLISRQYVINNINLDNYFHIQDQKPSGTQGDTITFGSWNRLTLNTIQTNTIVGSSLLGSVITLPPGKYKIIATEPVAANNPITTTTFKMRVRNTTLNVTEIVGTGTALRNPDASSTILADVLTAKGIINLTTTTTLEVQMTIAGVSTITNGSATSSGEDEVYGDIEIFKVG